MKLYYAPLSPYARKVRACAITREVDKQITLVEVNPHASPAELAGLDHTFQYSAIGSPETVRRKLDQVLALTQADELMFASQIYDHGARKRSYEILASLRG